MYKPLPSPPQSKADVKNIVAQVVQKMRIHHEQAEEFRHRNKREGIWFEGWGPFSLGVPGHDVNTEIIAVALEGFEQKGNW